MAVIDYMRSGDALIMWRLDRLARFKKQLIKTVEHLEGRQVGFRSLTESFNTKTSGGKLDFHIFSAVVELEQSIIQDRTHAGLAAAGALGRSTVLDNGHGRTEGLCNAARLF